MSGCQVCGWPPALASAVQLHSAPPGCPQCNVGTAMPNGTPQVPPPNCRFQFFWRDALDMFSAPQQAVFLGSVPPALSVIIATMPV